MLAGAAGRLLETIHFCRSFRLSSGIILPLNLGVLELNRLMETCNRKSMLAKKDCTRGGTGKGGAWAVCKTLQT